MQQQEAIPQATLDEIDETYLRFTLKELPKSPMIPQKYFDAIPRKELDLEYGDDPLQKIDLYLPQASTIPAPLVIFIHGGGFVAGDKADMQVSVYWGLLNHGYAVASINYRLAPAAKFPEPVKDIKDAIRFLKIIAPSRGIDPARVAAVGNSAGGYYTLMAAATPNLPIFDGDLTRYAYDSSVRCAIATYPCVDFRYIGAERVENGQLDSSDDEESPETLFLGTTPAKADPKLLEDAGVLTYINRNMPPMIVRAGLADTTVPCQQSQILADKLAETVDPDRYEFELVPGAGHHAPEFKRPAYLAEATAFLDKYLK